MQDVGPLIFDDSPESAARTEVAQPMFFVGVLHRRIETSQPGRFHSVQYRSTGADEKDHLVSCVTESNSKSLGGDLRSPDEWRQTGNTDFHGSEGNDRCECRQWTTVHQAFNRGARNAGTGLVCGYTDLTVQRAGSLHRTADSGRPSATVPADPIAFGRGRR